MAERSMIIQMQDKRSRPCSTWLHSRRHFDDLRSVLIFQSPVSPIQTKTPVLSDPAHSYMELDINVNYVDPIALPSRENLCAAPQLLDGHAPLPSWPGRKVARQSQEGLAGADFRWVGASPMETTSELRFLEIAVRRDRRLQFPWTPSK